MKALMAVPKKDADEKVERRTKRRQRKQKTA